MNTNRDTQFKGFAEKLYQEIQDMACSFSADPDINTLNQRECEIIAHRAYDLVRHVLDHIDHINLDRLSTDEHIKRIPDLPTLPLNQAE